MNLFRTFAALLAAAAFLPAAAVAQGKSVVTTERVRAELLAHAPEGVEPGKPVWVGLQLAHQPEWHTYWKNSGDSGLPTQLAWTLRHDGVIAIPKASRPEHVRQNAAAADIGLTKDDLAELDRAFRPPRGKVPLEMI